jgi:hypothetical protein
MGSKCPGLPLNILNREQKFITSAANSSTDDIVVNAY